MDQFSVTLALLPFLLYMMVLAVPFPLYNSLVEVSKMIRLYAVKRYGNREADFIYFLLGIWAKQNKIPQDVYEKTFNKFRDRIVWAEGNLTVNKLHSLPNPSIERDFYLGVDRTWLSDILNALETKIKHKPIKSVKFTRAMMLAAKKLR